MTEKIKQIIPAPVDMWALYAREGDSGEPPHAMRVACLALLDCGDVQAMVADGDGVIDFADAASNFVGYEFKRAGCHHG